ncbi:hypothetical protein [Streptomyces antimycoticus]|uniref:hypothetical protein n=1 Tax=Streptomyces antimycoticus TaxID=68175 RepID=UPI000A377337|nr:hypothetical protein [Streptomyces antimycoticus]
MTGRRDELAYIDATLPMAEVLADAFSDFDYEASLKRIARLAVSRVTDKMDHCARMVQAESGSRARPQNYGLPVYRQAAAELDRLSSEVVRDPDTVDAMARLVDDRSRIEPAGALTFACLLYLSDRHEGAQFWWQFAAGAGVATAAYCLYLHHAQYSEDDMAQFWYCQAFLLHHPVGDDLSSVIAIGPPTPLSPAPRPVAAATAAVPAETSSWALDHAKLADAVCRLDASTDEDYGHVPRPDPALAAELEEHFA